MYGQLSVGGLMEIIIKEKFKDDYTTREAGENLRKMITNADEKVTLNFIDLKVASASFFDEGVAKLSENEGWNEEQINEKIEFINLFKRDKDLLKSVCQHRNINLKVD